MTEGSIWRERLVVWGDLFYDLGYEAVKPAWPGWHERSLVLAAVKRPDYDDEPVRITVAEVWLPGDDPHGLVSTAHGCHLLASSWNANFYPGGFGQERRDLDRRHLSEEVHRHPLGRANDCREVLHGLGTPDDWMLGTVEALIVGTRGL